jgi:hypothetical protein
MQCFFDMRSIFLPIQLAEQVVFAQILPKRDLITVTESDDPQIYAS